MSESLLSVEDLKVHFVTDDGVVKAVDGVSFEVEQGRTLGIVGESGCGKSVANLTILGLTRAPNARISGRIMFEGQDLIELDEDRLQQVRGNEISMIFQDPLTSLHPFYRVGKQLTEAILVHQDVSDRQARGRAIELLGLVGIPDPERRVDDFPHEFSGGMRQRAMIAMALTNDPKLLIADEPTTALDVTTQAQILRLIERLQAEFKMAVIMITHDLGVIAEVAADVMVMYAGRVVEAGTLDQIFYDPQHPYTWGLLGSLTRIDRARTSRRAQISGQPPSLIAPPEGCHFRPRCPHAFGRCTQVPGLEVRGGEPGHADRCWLAPDQKQRLRVLDTGEIGLESVPDEAEQITAAPATPAPAQGGTSS
jgi:oligopeptide/dipeptide ABC transporter ATP-binding protein